MKIGDINAQGFLKGDGEYLNPENQLLNGAFESWLAGTSVAPDEWSYGGGGGPARESTTVKMGTYSAKYVSSAGSLGYLEQDIHSLKGIDYWKGKKVTLACWVWCDTADKAFIRIDGQTTYSDSSFHSGGSSWELLTVTHTVDNTDVALGAKLVVNAGTITAYFDGATMVEGSIVFTFNPKPLEHFSDKINFFDSGILGLPKQSGCRVYRTTAQTIGHNSPTKVELDSEEYDIQNEFDSTTNYRFTATKPGKYAFVGTVYWNTPNGADKLYVVNVKKNGAGHSYNYARSVSTSSFSMTVSDIADLDTNDYLELGVHQESGSDDTITGSGGSYFLYFSVQKVG